jgi:hypothetical protein
MQYAMKESDFSSPETLIPYTWELDISPFVKICVFVLIAMSDIIACLNRLKTNAMLMKHS